MNCCPHGRSNYTCVLLPLYLLSDLLPPSQTKCTVYTDSVCLRGGGWIVLCRLYFCRNFTLCFWPNAEPTKLLHHPKQNDQWKRHKGVGVFKVPSSMLRSIDGNPAFNLGHNCTLANPPIVAGWTRRSSSGTRCPWPGTPPSPPASSPSSPSSTWTRRSSSASGRVGRSASHLSQTCFFLSVYFYKQLENLTIIYI